MLLHWRQHSVAVLFSSTNALAFHTDRPLSLSLTTPQITGRPGGSLDPDSLRLGGNASTRPTARPAPPADGGGGNGSGALSGDGSGEAASSGSGSGGSGGSADGNSSSAQGLGQPQLQQLQQQQANVVAVSPEALKALKPLKLCASSADLAVGQKVFAIGNPFGAAALACLSLSLP